MLPGRLYPWVTVVPGQGVERRLTHFCVPGLVGYARLCPGDQYEVQPGRSWEVQAFSPEREVLGRQ